MFLKCATNKHISAFDMYSDLPPSRQRNFKNRFLYWINEAHDRTVHHGFRSPFSKCYVFKRHDGRRLYGFKCQPKSDPAFELCVLVTGVRKKKDATDQAVLGRINDLSENLRVLRAVNELFERGKNR